MERCRWNHKLFLVALLALPCVASTPDSPAVSKVASGFTAAKVEYRAPEARAAIDFLGDGPSLSVKINGAGPFGLLLDMTSRTVVLDDQVVRDAVINKGAHS